MRKLWYWLAHCRNWAGLQKAIVIQAVQRQLQLAAPVIFNFMLQTVFTTMGNDQCGCWQHLLLCINKINQFTEPAVTLKGMVAERHP